MTSKKFTLDSVYSATTVEEVAEAYTQSAPDYDAHIEDELGWTGHLVMTDVALRYLDPSARVLDAGAGTGLFGARLSERGFTQLDGFDAAEGMLEIARARGIYRNLRVDFLGQPISWDSDSYDGVTACGVFLGSHAPPNGMEELVRVTRPGGHIIMTLRANRDPAKSGTFTTEDYRAVMRRLEDENAWRLIELTAPEQMLSGDHGSLHQIFVFQVSPV